MTLADKSSISAKQEKTDPATADDRHLTRAQLQAKYGNEWEERNAAEAPIAVAEVAMSDEEMRKVFAAFDADGNGTLEVAELLEFVKVCVYVCIVHDTFLCILHETRGHAARGSQLGTECGTVSGAEGWQSECCDECGKDLCEMGW